LLQHVLLKRAETTKENATQNKWDTAGSA